MNAAPTPKHAAFTARFNGIANRVITRVTIAPASGAPALPSSFPPGVEVEALWDTGATGSVITTQTAKTLGLIPTGAVQVNHAGGTGQANTYVVHMLLPNHVGIPGVIVSECPTVVGSFGAIIGMDIIRRGDLSITNAGGITCMSFVIPPMKHIDFVAEADRANFAGIGRNDPCPCGSGKKFKKCHGTNT